MISKSIKRKFRFCLAVLLLLMVGVSAYGQEKLAWHPFEKALSVADTSNRPVFIDVWAPWCGWCRKMKREVYPKLAQQMNNQFVLTRLNRDDNKTKHYYQGQQLTSLKLAKKLKSQSVPTIVLLDPEGDYLLHISGFIEAQKLEPVLEYISSRAYKNRSFEEFRRLQGL